MQTALHLTSFRQRPRAIYSGYLFLSGCSHLDYTSELEASFFEVQRDNPCFNGATWDEPSAMCLCEPGWAGEWCHRRARDCSEIYNYSPTYRGPAYVDHVIQADGMTSPITVLCYMRWGGYTYFMERKRTSCNKIDFNQNYAAYKAGFGERTCDFWLGLDNLHHVTNNNGRKYTLDVTLYFPALLTTNPIHQSYYPDFVVEDESNGYRVQMSSYIETAVIKRAEDALYLPSDPINSMNGQMFSSWDRDQDSSSSQHCAQDMQAGWWFNDCGLSNLNGRRQPTTDFSRNMSVPSMWWGVGQFHNLSISSVNPKIRGENS